MADGLTVAAPAKINLALYVGQPRADGYHPVATLMLAVDGLADDVHVRRARTRRVHCPDIDGPANLAWTALDALARLTDRPMDLAVTITKRVPAQAGLGGGSSDAAAVLRLARALLDLPIEDAQLEAVAAEVGSDVPFFIRCGAQWATGRGERLTPAPPPQPELWGVVTPPGAALSTGRVYAAFDRLGRGSPPIPVTLGDWRRDPSLRNDLWPAAFGLAPQLGRSARALRVAGAERVLLCGSGGSLVGLWSEEEGARRGARTLGAAGLAVVKAPIAAPRPKVSTRL